MNKTRTLPRRTFERSEEIASGGKSQALFASALEILKSGWFVAALLSVSVSLLFYEVFRSLVYDWYRDPDYSHGFLVPLLAGYFVWERRETLRRLTIAPSYWGAVLLGMGLAMLVLGSVGAEYFTQRVAFIVVVAGIVLLVLGREYLWTLAFPIAFLVFMVPLPAIIMNSIAFPLQMFAAKTATACLYSLGIPVLREGNVIVLSQTTLEVAEACSGIRSLQALMALGAVYAYFTQRSTWKQWLLLGLTIPIAIAANAFRVSGTGVLAHYWGIEAAQGFYHTLSGLVIFGVAFALLLVAGAVVSRLPEKPEKEKAS